MKKYSYILIAIFISAAFYKGLNTLEQNLTPLFTEAEESYKDGRAINLDTLATSEAIAKLLLDNRYVDSDSTDADSIANWLVKRIKECGLKNLGALNTDSFKIPVSKLDEMIGQRKEGYLWERCQSSLRAIGYDSALVASPDTLQGDYVIQATVLDGKKPVPHVLVSLKEHKKVTDTTLIVPRKIDDARIISYTFTDEEGRARFKVHKDGYYSVLPINRGYEYGAPKGCVHGKVIAKEKKFYEWPWFSDEIRFEFKQREHRIKIFDGRTFANIKADKTFTVRTPETYKSTLHNSFILFFCMWWFALACVYFRDWLLIRRDSVHYVPADKWPLLFLMALDALSIVVFYAIPAPLTDILRGWDMAGFGTIVGLTLLCFFSWWDYVSIFAATPPAWLSNYIQNHPSFKKWWSRIDHFWGLGYGYLSIALLFVVLLGFFGTSPEGSSARVNLTYPFTWQPSEVSKYLIVCFISLFLTANSWRISQFASGGHKFEQLRVLWIFLLSIFSLVLLYVGILSDMGPALVLIVTFIFLYSFARQDFLQLTLGTTFFLILLWACSLLVDSKVAPVVAFAVWSIIWFLYGRRKGQIFESAVLMNVLILLFSIGGYLIRPVLHNQGQRLLDRTAIMGEGAWNNAVKGGDQIANGIWALASGGMGGQGLGHGNANLIPAYHTDMIFESIGEVLGGGMLILIILFFGIVTINSIFRAVDTKHTFLKFMVSGIAIVTCVQFFIIVLGSLGLIPLTGISVPFLSYGRAGLIINMAAFGIMIAMTRLNSGHSVGTEEREKRNIKWGLCILSIIPLMAIGKIVSIQFNRDYYLTRPAFVTTLSGERFVEQNPRIQLLLCKLHSGNIYDRNGLLLATSYPKAIIVDSLKYKKGLIDAGLTEEQLQIESHKHKSRYYPFGNHLFFMLGDVNTRNLLGSIYERKDAKGRTVTDPYGYFAEERHIDKLKGMTFNIDSVKNLPFSYKFAFLSAEPDTCGKLTYRDYSKNNIIIQMLKDGIDGEEVKNWNDSVKRKEERDIKMTIDATLQMRLQNILKDIAENASNKIDKKDLDKTFIDKPFSRASLVIINDSGDLLCSANYPLPDQSLIEDRFRQGIYTYRMDSVWGRYTERDLGLTYQTQPGSTAKIMSAMAGFMQLKDSAKIKSYVIYKEERVHDDNGSEPPTPTDGPKARVDMKSAIVKSSNCYFINLVHDKKLYPQLNKIYQAVGANVLGNLTYVFDFPQSQDTVFTQMLNETGQNGYDKYKKYIENRRKPVYDNNSKFIGYKNNYEKMKWHECAMAWGQGDLRASPLNMARAISIVANDGQFIPNRYIISNTTETKISKYIPLFFLDDSSDSTLKSYLHAESFSRSNTSGTCFIGGKTGTPTRLGKIYCNGNIVMCPRKDNSGKTYFTEDWDMNDGWYVCMVNSTEHGNLSIALRLEKVRGSGTATFWMKHIINALCEYGYIKNTWSNETK